MDEVEENNLRIIQFIKGRGKSLALAVIALLVIVLVAAGYVSQRQQTLKAPPLANLQMVSPKAGMKVLGNTPIAATAKTKERVENLEAVLKVDGSSPKVLDLKRIDKETVNISGVWESGKSKVGQHTLEIVLYSNSTKSPTRLGSLTVPLTVVAP